MRPVSSHVEALLAGMLQQAARWLPIHLMASSCR